MNYTQFHAKKLVPMNALYVPSTLGSLVYNGETNRGQIKGEGRIIRHGIKNVRKSMAV